MVAVYIDSVHLGVILFCVVLSFTVFFEIGLRLGLFHQRNTLEEKSAQVSPVMGAVLGLLAFMMAFTFSAAGKRFDDRRQLTIDEANIIGTVYLRADFLPEPARSSARLQLRDYVDIRLQAATSKNASDLNAVQDDAGPTGAQKTRLLEQSTDIHAALWRVIAERAQTSHGSVYDGLYVRAVNALIDMHETRWNRAVMQRISGSIWLALFFIAALTMVVMGYHAGLAGSRSIVATSAVIITFALVLSLIVDLDRPANQLFNVSQSAMMNLKEAMANEH